MPGLFDNLPRPPRQRPFATPQAAPGPGWMQGFGNTQQSAGGAPDASGRALQQYGPNGLLALQMYKAMMQKGPRGVMDPKNASAWFTPLTIGGLAPRYQAAYAKQTKGK